MAKKFFTAFFCAMFLFAVAKVEAANFGSVDEQATVKIFFKVLN